jgi:hypothetical protein
MRDARLLLSASQVSALYRFRSEILEAGVHTYAVVIIGGVRAWPWCSAPIAAGCTDRWAFAPGRRVWDEFLPGSPADVDHGRAAAPIDDRARMQPPECGKRAREETMR